MSIPKHRVLSTSRSINTTAKINSDSQKNNQIQNVNVVVTQPPRPDTTPDPQQPPPVAYPPIYDQLPIQPVITERSADDIQYTLEQQIHDKDNLIKALSLILDINRSNPLIINKYIIPSSFNLQELILLLTNAESVELQFEDPDIGCFCIPDDFLHIKSIYIIKDGNQYIFKHAFPQAVRILDDNKISYKLAIFNPEPETKKITYDN